MRTFGFLVAIIGGLVIYLGWNGKVTPFFSALFTGSVPSTSGSTSTKTTIGTGAAPSAMPVMQNSILKYR